MKAALIFFSLTITSLPAMAYEQFDESIRGTRFEGNHRCGIGHLTLKAIPDAAFVADFSPTKDEWDEEVPDAGSLVINDLDFQTYNKILYSNETISTTFQASVITPYAVIVKASSNGTSRTVRLSMAPRSANYHPKELTINLQRGQIQEMTLVDQKPSFFGGYKVAFKDTCVF